MKYISLSRKWLKYQKEMLKPSSYANYNFLMHRHINTHFGDFDISKITIDDINKFIINKKNNGRLDNTGGLAEATLEDIVSVLKLSFEYANSLNYSKINTKLIKIPKIDFIEEKVKIFTDIEIEKLTSHLENNLNHKNLGILIAIYTGIRIGELSALKWSDIDLNTKTITINKTLQRVYTVENKTEIIIGSTKSKKSNRIIPINTRLFITLHKLHTHNNFYVLTGNNHYCEPRCYRLHYQKTLQTLNLPQLPFHSLRHTFATRCIYASSDYKTVSELLGHSSVAITLDVYSHTDHKKKTMCINSI